MLCPNDQSKAHQNPYLTYKIEIIRNAPPPTVIFPTVVYVSTLPSLPGKAWLVLVKTSNMIVFEFWIWGRFPMIWAFWNQMYNFWAIQPKVCKKEWLFLKLSGIQAALWMILGQIQSWLNSSKKVNFIRRVELHCH